MRIVLLIVTFCLLPVSISFAGNCEQSAVKSAIGDANVSLDSAVAAANRNDWPNHSYHLGVAKDRYRNYAVRRLWDYKRADNSAPRPLREPCIVRLDKRILNVKKLADN